ncbi:MAG TPA: septal ring lytic transglycosylase RlpA family protein [Pseudomonadales bacterium]|nr:septal ring lytic transglycosylase RlpA family protein [Pseudomonadales bacterium]
MSIHTLIPQLKPSFRLVAAISLAVLASACSTTGGNHSSAAHSNTGNNGRYAMDKDAGPDDGVRLDPDKIQDAVPVDEPRTAAGNKSPYTVLGETYNVMPESTGYSQTGKASWYGKKFHGYKTSNGEIYSMYKMSGAHKTLPIPSYVRVTNLDNGRTAIVRINDRGPFHSDRIIDLSYAAAVKLDVARTGTANVKLETITPSTSAYAAREAEKDELPETVTSVKPAAHSKPALTTVAAREPANQKTRAPIDDFSIKSAQAKPAKPASVPAAVAVTTPVQTASDSGTTWLQAAAFRNEDSANNLRNKLASITGRQVKIDSAQGLHKVRIGPLADQKSISQVTEILVQNNLGKPQVVYF